MVMEGDLTWVGEHPSVQGMCCGIVRLKLV